MVARPINTPKNGMPPHRDHIQRAGYRIHVGWFHFGLCRCDYRGVTLRVRWHDSLHFGDEFGANGSAFRTSQAKQTLNWSCIQYSLSRRISVA
jgi:hypothetical protein